VDQAAALPSFSDYAANYGGKVPNTSNLAGKKIMIIPGVSALAACTEIAQADAAIATALGMKATIFANQGSTAEHNTAIENAIHQGYAAIAMGCAMDPSTSAPAISQALAAGIKVSVYGATTQEAAVAKVTYNNVDPMRSTPSSRLIRRSSSTTASRSTPSRSRRTRRPPRRSWRAR
jgi:ABC-type sugar transport system substrate-binding protein